MGRTQLTGEQVGPNSIPIGDINATGTPSSTTFLRGDGVWIAPPGGGSGSPAGATNSVQFNSAGAFGGAANASITAEGNLNLAAYISGTNPATPATGLTVFARNRGGRNVLAQMGTSGIDMALQPFLGANKILLWSPTGANLTTFSLWGSGTPFTTMITATARPLTTTNALSASRRLGFNTAATVNLNTGLFLPAQIVYPSTANNRGGFYYVVRFGLPTLTAAQRVFIGLADRIAVMTATVEPSAQTGNYVALSADAADTNFQIITRNNVTTTKTNTGIAKINQSAILEVTLFMAPNSATLQWGLSVIIDASTSHVSGSVTATLPAANTLLAPHILANSGAVAAITQLDILSIYLETDTS